jgi:hypothetical protein
MIYIKNEKGVALVMALILATVTLAFASSLLYIATQGTKMSGLQKRYKTALAAAKGGVELSTNIIVDRGDDSSGLSTNVDPDCLLAKLLYETAEWDTVVTTEKLHICDNNAAQLNSDPTDWPDLTIGVGTAPHAYTLSVKIIDTVQGNAAPTGGGGKKIDTESVVEGGAGAAIKPQHIPYLYTVEVYSINDDNPNEVSQITYLYAH